MNTDVTDGKKVCIHRAQDTVQQMTIIHGWQYWTTVYLHKYITTAYFMILSYLRLAPLPACFPHYVMICTRADWCYVTVVVRLRCMIIRQRQQLTWANCVTPSSQQRINGRYFNVWNCVNPVKVSNLVRPFNNSFPHVGNFEMVVWWCSVSTYGRYQQYNKLCKRILIHWNVLDSNTNAIYVNKTNWKTSIKTLLPYTKLRQHITTKTTAVKH